MRNNLNRLSQIISTAFFFDNILIDTTGRNIIGTCCLNIGKTLIMTQIEIGLMTVDGYIAFAMFIGIQRTRVDIDIRVELLNCNFISSCLQKFCQRGRYNTFTQRRYNTACNENILCIHFKMEFFVRIFQCAKLEKSWDSAMKKPINYQSDLFSGY